MKKVVLLFSPGLDSFLANTILSKRKNIELIRLYFDLGSRYSRNEIIFLQKRYCSTNNCPDNARNIIIESRLNIGFLERPDAYIPNRNLTLVTAASAMVPNADEIYINSMKDDRVSDSNKELFENYSVVLSQSIGYEVKIKSLFWEIEKADAIREYTAREESKLDLLMHTYSCFAKEYNGKLREVFSILNTISGPMYNKLGTFFIEGCLSCPACFRRACALTAAGIYLPFLNLCLTETYRRGIDPEKHPSRYETVKNYLEFLDNDPKDFSI